MRMAEEVGFQKFYTNLYDLLRLCHLRIFNEKAPRLDSVNDALNKGSSSELGGGEEVLGDQ